ATDRIVRREVSGGSTSVVRYGYSGGGDTSDFTLDANNNLIERTIPLLGGVLLTKRGGGGTWSYPNVHGDVMATADGAGAKQGATMSYDPYGQALGALPDNSAGNFDYGWLGRHQRGTEHEAGIATIEMGARQYVPGLGRFLEVDPVEGGSCNDYDYVCGDPVNGFDLDGTCFVFCPVVVVVAIPVGKIVAGAAVGSVIAGGVYLAKRAGRNDPHGDSGRRAKRLERDIQRAREQLERLNREGGSRRDKVRLRDKIDNLRRDAERARRGETHHRR
ncbi:MAG: hypothetical protein KY454_12945, partial [Actinobacteria bacterium]|nr:hypothetical protein [Actinomycetota bacterium]